MTAVAAVRQPFQFLHHPLAARFALFVQSEQGQAILRRYGFDPIGLP